MNQKAQRQKYGRRCEPASSSMFFVCVEGGGGPPPSIQDLLNS